jgi:hypothetical protein
MYSSSWKEAKADYKFTVNPITESNLLQKQRFRITNQGYSKNVLRVVDKLEWLSKPKEREKSNNNHFHFNDLRP